SDSQVLHLHVGCGRVDLAARCPGFSFPIGQFPQDHREAAVAEAKLAADRRATPEATGSGAKKKEDVINAADRLRRAQDEATAAENSMDGTSSLESHACGNW